MAFFAWRFHFDVVRAFNESFKLGVRIPNFMIPRSSMVLVIG
jgi:hypothetical protein